MRIWPEMRRNLDFKAHPHFALEGKMRIWSEMRRKLDFKGHPHFTLEGKMRIWSEMRRRLDLNSILKPKRKSARLVITISIPTGPKSKLTCSSNKTHSSRHIPISSTIFTCLRPASNRASFTNDLRESYVHTKRLLDHDFSFCSWNFCCKHCRVPPFSNFFLF